MKKAVKKDIEKMNQIIGITKRKDFISAIKNYQRDVDATIRYYSIHNMDDKFVSKYRKDLTVKEELSLFKRYNVLNQYINYFNYINYNGETVKEDPHFWNVVSLILNNPNKIDSKTNFEQCDINSDLIIEEIIWTEEEAKLIIKLARKFGYKRIFFFDGSSGALEAITNLIKNGCTICGVSKKTVRRSYDNTEWGVDKEGLIIEVN